MAKPYKLGNLSLADTFGDIVLYDRDRDGDLGQPGSITASVTKAEDEMGTKASGFVEAKDGPFNCGNCIHVNKEKDRCNHSKVMADPETKHDKEGLVIIAKDDCCRYMRSEQDLMAAAELPDIEGFDADVTKEIRKYLIQFPRKLLHFTTKVISDPEMTGVHGRWKDGVIQLNPGNFTNGLKFGTHDPADIDAHVIAHELGHGLFESQPEDVQKVWCKLSGWKLGIGVNQAPPYVEKRPGWPKGVSKWTHSKDAKFARKYQEKNPNEDFADNVAYISTGNGSDVPKEKREFIEKLL